MLDRSDDKALVDAVIHAMLNATHVTAIDGAQGVWYCADSEGHVHVRTATDWQALPTNLGAWLTDITVAGPDAFCVVGHKGVLGLGNAQDVRPLPTTWITRSLARWHFRAACSSVATKACTG